METNKNNCVLNAVMGLVIGALIGIVIMAIYIRNDQSKTMHIAVPEKMTDTVEIEVQPEHRQTGAVVLYGYLNVMIEDLGEWDNEPKEIISRINEHKAYGIDTWRLPTNEELILIKNSGYTYEDKEYITIDWNRFNGLLQKLKTNTDFLKEKLSKGVVPDTVPFTIRRIRNMKYSNSQGYVLLVSDGRVIEHEDDIISEFQKWNKKWEECKAKANIESNSLKSK